MSAMAAALSPMANPQPAAPPARDSDGRSGEFARCLDQARESDGADTADSGAADKAAETGEAPQRPAAKVRSGRESAAPRKGDAQTVKDAPPKAAVDTDTPCEAGAAAGDAAHDDAGAPDLAALLPGWSPPVVAATTAAPNAKAPDGADALSAVAGAGGSTTAASSARDGAAARTVLPIDAQALRMAAAVGTNTPATTTSSSTLPQTTAGEQKDLLPASQAATAPMPMPVALTAAPAVHKTVEAVPLTATLQSPIDTPAFAPALATQVRWWANDGVQQAQLLLNPAEMGPVAVKIVLDGREARIDFSADVAATRSAIEAALPVLAAALDDSGLKLSGGGVHDGSAQHQSSWQDRGVNHRPSGTGSIGAADALGGGAASSATGRGLVDLVA
jgi:flagellar hook-length control protein FliK